MATWLPEDTFASVVLDGLTASSLELLLFTTAPTPSGAATDGTEVVGGAYDRQAITFGAAMVSTGARIMQKVSTNSQLFTDMPVASTSVVGWGLADATTGEIRLVNDSWTPAVSFAIGDDFLVQAGEITLYGARVA